MKTLDELKEAFLELYPAEENTREQRLRIAQGKCENCGKVLKLQFHHVIWRGNRKKDFERVFTTRMFCYDCNQSGKKYLALPKSKKEVEAVLLQDFDTLDTINIMGSSGLEQ